MPQGQNGKESTWNAGDLQVTLAQSLDLKIPWGRKWQPTPAFLPGKFHGQGSLAGSMG